VIRIILARIYWVLEARDGTSAVVNTFLARILIMIANLGTGILTARMLGPEGRGVLASVTLWPGFLAYCLTLGLPVSTIYHIRKYPEKASEFFSAACILSIFLGLIASTVGICGLSHWMASYSDSTILAAKCFVLTAPLVLLNLLLGSILESLDEFAYANYLKSLFPFLTLTSLTGFYAIDNLDPFTAAISYTLPVFILVLVALNRIKRKLHFSGQISIGTYKQLLIYGFKIYGVDLLGNLSGQAGQALSLRLMTPMNVGFYNLAANLTRNLSNIQASITTVLLPKAVGKTPYEISDLIGFAVRISILALSLLIIPLFIFSPILIHFMYGEEFHNAISAFQILLIEAGISCVAWILSQVFIINGKPGITTLMQAISLGSTIPLMLLLVPKYELTGACFALLISSSIRLCSILVCFPLVLKIRPPNFLITSDDIHLLKCKVKYNT
jgi:O-antigen/teichoic acid export membrane protein